jgi:hypothetical protein
MLNGDVDWMYCVAGALVMVLGLPLLNMPQVWADVAETLRHTNTPDLH